MVEWITNIDMNILLFIQEHLRTPIVNAIMTVITTLGDGGVFWILLSGILIIFKPTRKAGICALIAICIGFIFNNLLLKNLIARARPYDQFSQLLPLIAKPTDYSFPSGHTCSSFAASLTLFHYLNKKRVGICAIILAILIAFSRLYVGVHFPSDVLVGMIIGIASSIAVCKFADSHKILLPQKIE